MTDISADRSIKRHTLLGAALIAVLVIVFGGWTTMTEIAGAVVTPATVVVENSVKKIQHPTGGVVAELHVREGDDVKEGELLLKLDGTQATANLDIIRSSLDELTARQARLEAERDGAPEVAFPLSLSKRMKEESMRRLLTGEAKLFVLRNASRNGQKQQLAERIHQLEEETNGLSAQSAAKDRELALIAKELTSTNDLYRKGLITLARVTELERTAARLDGERGQLVAGIAEARGKIAEIQLQIIQIDQQLRSEVGVQLADVRAKTQELIERRTAAEDQIKRLEVRSPQAGTVHELSVHTLGGVVLAGEALMVIVPAAARLVVEAHIPPAEVERVSPGQTVTLRFSSFDQSTTPAIRGTLMRLAPAISFDQRSGTAFYAGAITISATELSKLGGSKLMPGMPVEAFIMTESRTVLSYLAKPFYDQLFRAFRQE
jgi:membrane fusion protein, type I secretion system